MWGPHPGPQRQFLASKADEILFGGASGGGKSAATVALPLRWVSIPEFSALILRREQTQFKDLLNKMWRIYPTTHPGATFNGSTHTWRFPSGAEIRLGHCKDENDKFNYQGHEFSVILWDELTHFTKSQFLEVCTRLRSATPGLPRYIRATSNPGGDGHAWVLERFRYWLDPKSTIPGRDARFDALGRQLPPAEPGEVLWLAVNADGKEEVVPRGTPKAMSRQFIPALLSDNPSLEENDPDYRQKLLQLDPVRRAQLLEGDWLVQPGKGLYFKRTWFPVVDRSSVKIVSKVRAWDVGATVEGDPTVGTLLGRTDDNQYVVLDVVRFRGTPSDVDAMILATANQDGHGVPICLPQDPGAAGVSQVSSWSRMLTGFTFRFVRPTGDKITRAGPVSSQSQAENVAIVSAEWNGEWLSELEAFPESKNDDQVDSLADAFNALSRPRSHGSGPRGTILTGTVDTISLV